MNSDPIKTKSSAVEFHTALAAKWDDGYLSPSFSCRLAVISELLPTASGRWLDAGCGTGTIARWMSSTYGCEIEGIDASTAMVAEAKLRGTKAQVGSVEQLPYATNSLDGIICSSVLEYLDDPCVALREFCRVLKAERLLLISVPRWQTHKLMWLVHYLTLCRWYSASRYSKHCYTANSFGATLTRCGFLKEDHRCFSPLDLPLGVSLDLGGTLTMFRARVVKS
jgi:SAM-dependent methyltransferase